MSDLRSIDPDRTPLAVRHNPSTNTTNCHTVSVTQGATSGQGSALNIDSHNPDAPLIRGKGPGPLVRLYNAAGVLRFEVANDGTVTTATVGTLTVTGNATVGGTLGVTGAATLSSTLAVSGTSTLSGAVTITGNLTDAGDLLVRDSHTVPGKAYRFRSSGGALDTDFGGNDWYWSNFPNADFSGTQRTYMRWENGAATMHIVAEAQFKADVFGARVHTLNGAANTLGFHGATPVARQTISGSRSSGAALADLLTKLATVGLFVDGTSA